MPTHQSPTHARPTSANTQTPDAPAYTHSTHKDTTPSLARSADNLRKKHNHLRDILYKWLVNWGYFTQREQHIPELDDTDNDGNPRQAILDIYTTINDRQYLIDISVTDAVSDCQSRTKARSNKDATAAMEREQQKRHRYKNDPRLVPFVFEVGGRWGPTAEAWIKTLAPTDPAERATALAHLRYEISASLQRSNADMIITAHH